MFDLGFLTGLGGIFFEPDVISEIRSNDVSAIVTADVPLPLGMSAVADGRLGSSQAGPIHINFVMVGIPPLGPVFNLPADCSASSIQAGIAGNAALPRPEISVTGVCPGEVAIDISGITPNGQVAILSAVSEGTFTILGGSCAGTEVDLANPTAPAGACGLFLQAVDVTTCTPGNVAQVP